MRIALIPFVIFIFYTSSFASKRIILKDKLAFKVAGEVFTLSEVKELYESGRQFACFFEESLTLKLFEKFFANQSKDIFEAKKRLSSIQKNYLLSGLDYAKIYMYRKSYPVKIDRSLKKYLKLVAMNKKCSDSKEFSENLQEILKIEIFLRERFLPVELQRQSTDDEMKKAIKSASSFLNSISEQIEQEVYW